MVKKLPDKKTVYTRKRSSCRFKSLDGEDDVTQTMDRDTYVYDLKEED